MKPGRRTYQASEQALSLAEASHDAAVASCRALTKRFGELTAVDGITFSLERGTVTGFLGPNGAGKTTTLRLLLGLAEPTAGQALVFGRRYRELEQPIRHVGAVLESADFHPSPNGRDHLRALALAAGLPLARVEEVLELVELRSVARRRVRTYSLGMRQRLGLAAALLGDPELLILDEPANGLDPAGVRWLRTFLQAFAAQGRTVLVSSHLLAEVAQTVGRILIIDHGRLLAGGRPRRAHRRRAHARGRLPRADGGGAVVTGQLRSELLKQRSTPTTLLLFVAMFGLVAFAVAMHVLALGAEQLSARSRSRPSCATGRSGRPSSSPPGADR